MKLDRFDQKVLETKGNASDVMYELYEKEIGLNNAQKQLAGIRTHINYKAVLGNGRDIGEMEETIVRADGSVTTKRMLLLSEEDAKNPNRIMELMGYDPLQWKVKWCETRRNYWDVTIKNAAKVGVKHTNHAYMCKLTVESIQDILTLDHINKIFDDLPSPKVQDYIYDDGNRGLEFGLIDFHLGKGLSLDDEVDLFKHTILKTLGKLESYLVDLEKIWFQIGQDFIHIDSSNRTTTYGTPMETRHEWSEIFDCAVECILWSAEQFRKICPVEYIYIPGNHDKTLSYCLAKIVEKVYADSSAVTVDTIDFPRKYRKYGINAFGLSHGREEGKRIRTKFQEEAADILAATQYREFHLADKHHEESMEDGDIIYRTLPTVTDLDNWHISKGYKSLRRCTSYLWNPEGGKDILEVFIKS